MRRLAAGLAAAAIFFSGGACDGSDVSDAFLSAAEAAEDAQSARMEMTVEIALGSQDVTVEAEGAFDFADELGTMTMSTSSGAGMPGVGNMEMILDGDHMYVKGAAFARALEGKEWGRIDLTAAGTAGSGPFNQDPTQYLDWLRGTGEDVEEVGQEEIDGIRTTHWEADLPVDGIVDQAPDEDAAARLRAGFAVFGGADSFPVDVWVDDDGLPRRIKMLLESDKEGGPSSDIMIDLFDYGVDVEIEPPESYRDIQGPAG